MGIIKHGLTKNSIAKEFKDQDSNGSSIRIISSVATSNAKQNSKDLANSNDTIPFVPALDLLRAKRSKLSSEQVAAIGMALYLSTPDPDELNQTESPWLRAARQSSLR